jgi:hypothetical protein
MSAVHKILYQPPPAGDGEVPAPTPPTVTEPPRLLRELIDSGAHAAVGKGLQIAAESVAPGGGAVVKAGYLVAGLVDAVGNFCNGRGVDVNTSLVDVAGGYSVGVRIRLGDADPAPASRFGVGLDWNSGVDWLDAAAVDGAPDNATYGAVVPAAGYDPSPATYGGMDTETIVRRAEERFKAPGVCEETWYPFVIRFPASEQVVADSGDASDSRAGRFQVVLRRKRRAPYAEET